GPRGRARRGSPGAGPRRGRRSPDLAPGGDGGRPPSCAAPRAARGRVARRRESPGRRSAPLGAPLITPSVPLLPKSLLLGTLLFIPLRILGEGYWPTDDALHHAAKAVSGKDWSEILVLRADVTGDTNPGWRVFESTVDRLTDWDPPALVLFS